MLYKIVYEDDSIEYMNERIIMSIKPIKGEGDFILKHFNGNEIRIKNFYKG